MKVRVEVVRKVVWIAALEGLDVSELLAVLQGKVFSQVADFLQTRRVCQKRLEFLSGRSPAEIIRVCILNTEFGRVHTLEDIAQSRATCEKRLELE